MGKKVCNSCGAVVSDNVKFCEQCGTPVGLEPGAEPVSTSSQIPLIDPLVDDVDGPADRKTGKMPVMIVAGIIIILIVVAAAVFFVLPKLSGTASGIPAPVLPSGTLPPASAAITSVPTLEITPVVATPTAETAIPALALKEKYTFGSGDIESVGTVYRFWMNDTYQWHNDMDNHYYVQKSRDGYKFLVIFVDVENKGNTRVWPPTPNNIHLLYDDREYFLDQNHYLPDKSVNIKATPIEIKEIQYVSKLTGSEYVEDYGYSHGTELSYLYPGISNAIDGYLIYEVPDSLKPEKTYVRIEFNGKDVGVWKLE